MKVRFVSKLILDKFFQLDGFSPFCDASTMKTPILGRTQPVLGQASVTSGVPTTRKGQTAKLLFLTGKQRNLVSSHAALQC